MGSHIYLSFTMRRCGQGGLGAVILPAQHLRQLGDVGGDAPGFAVMRLLWRPLAPAWWCSRLPPGQLSRPTLSIPAPRTVTEITRLSVQPSIDSRCTTLFTSCGCHDRDYHRRTGRREATRLSVGTRRPPTKAQGAV